MRPEDLLGPAPLKPDLLAPSGLLILSDLPDPPDLLDLSDPEDPRPLRPDLLDQSDLWGQSES